MDAKMRKRGILINGRRSDVAKLNAIVTSRRQEELRLVESQLWRPIKGFPGYDVSDRGVIRSYWKIDNRENKHERILEAQPVFICRQKPSGGRIKYPTVRLGIAGKSGGKLSLVHILVLEAFVGPRPNGMEGCHNDGAPSNCTLSNLRWDTPKGNQADKRKHGTARLCEQHPNAKLDWEKARIIRERKYSVAEIAEKFNISPLTVYQVLRGDTWKIVGGESK